MIAALTPLTELPGVQLVMFVSEDGVPIAVPGRAADPADAMSEVDGGGASREEAIAAVATGWLREIREAVGQASLREPQRVVLRGARGALVMQRARGAVLLLLLGRGLAPEEVRLPMDATVARLNRSRRPGEERPAAPGIVLSDTPAPMPSAPPDVQTKDSLDAESIRDASQN